MGVKSGWATMSIDNLTVKFPDDSFTHPNEDV